MEDKEKKVLYPAAFDENGTFILASSFKDLEDTAREHHYRCLHCKEQVIPILGPKRTYHFRHLGQQCTYDRYLHSYAEEYFMAEYQHCLDCGLPFYLEMSIPVRCNKACVLQNNLDCEERYNRKEYDLTKAFRKVSKEVRVVTGDKSYRRPDILLERENGKPLWVEICVTHETTPLEHPSLGGIIEIKINSEEDVKRIFGKHRIVQSNDKISWVRLHGIGNSAVDEPMQRTPPCENHFVFDVLEGHYSGCGKIVRTVPEKSEDLLYRSVLKLNWNDTHDADGGAPTRYTKEFLDECCLDRFLTGKTGDLLVAMLRVEEYRADSGAPTDPLQENRRVASGRRRKDPHVASPEIREPRVDSTTPVRWVDLGLPSGTLWCDSDNNDNPSGLPEGYQIPSLPSRADIEELKAHCTQHANVVADILRVIGSGGSITFKPAKYLLSDRPKGFGVYYLSIYPLVDNYLHVNEDDAFGQGYYRFVAHKKG